MSSDQEPGIAERTLSAAERHRKNLKQVNEKLSELIASLRGQKERLVQHSQGTPAPPPCAGEGADPPSPERGLEIELAVAREALMRREEEDQALRRRLAEIEAEHQRVTADFVAVHEQNTQLVALYAAIERLHGAGSRGELLSAIQEIVIDVIGSEEFALFELATDGRRLVPTLAFGTSARDIAEITVGSGRIGRVAASGEVWTTSGEDAPAQEPNLTACVPLRIGDAITGVLAIYQLVAHKQSLTKFDREMLSLVARHGVHALQFRPRGRLHVPSVATCPSRQPS